MIDDVMLDAEDRMDKALEAARSGLASIRTGRANPSMFHGIMVDYYGAPTPLQQLASLTIPEARTVLITPFDRSATKNIVTAVRESDLGVNPTDDGTVIRVTLPALTEERRRDYVKLARSRAEESRVQVRGIRGRSKKELEAIKKDGEAGEDEVKRAEQELDALTRRYVEQVDAALAAKESELLDV
ncbi:ribosome recycling factor [Actinomyces sp. 2119]|uniref:Ribosome-recycling factor n=1 Tax=Actinomyces lilanjuaniae TaxID=2321394 RepID=A0ABN5PR54_9ACTO|nr:MULTISPECIES: ribosome recycling factor [Actinomyces]AYD89552.1 ribosome recycling factor [Actinomyces lilanjuaniae]RJF43088.1 ribosome recycling factor [Actinomyces sp. 2119]